MAGREKATRGTDPSLKAACEFTKLPEDVINKLATMNCFPLEGFVRMMQNDKAEESLGTINKAFSFIDLVCIARAQTAPDRSSFFSRDPDEEYSIITSAAANMGRYPINSREAFSCYLRKGFDKWCYGIEEKYDEYYSAKLKEWKRIEEEQEERKREAEKEENYGNDNPAKE